MKQIYAKLQNLKDTICARGDLQKFKSTPKEAEQSRLLKQKDSEICHLEEKLRSASNKETEILQLHKQKDAENCHLQERLCHQ